MPFFRIKSIVFPFQSFSLSLGLVVCGLWFNCFILPVQPFFSASFVFLLFSRHYCDFYLCVSLSLFADQTAPAALRCSSGLEREGREPAAKEKQSDRPAKRRPTGEQRGKRKAEARGPPSCRRPPTRTAAGSETRTSGAKRSTSPRRTCRYPSRGGEQKEGTHKRSRKKAH